MEFLSKTFYGNTIKEWGLAFILIIASVLVAKILYWVFKNVARKFTERSKTRLDDILLDMIEEPLVFAIALTGVWYSIKTLNFPTETDPTTQLEHTPFLDGLGMVYYVLIIFTIAWLINRLIAALIKEYLVPLTAKTESELDDQLLPILNTTIRIAVWTIAIIVALNNAGYDVGAIIAGLGIGGLAFALAAQDSVKNVFGGLTIFMDKPFKMGDRIKIDGYDGTIKEVGLRSTRLITLEGRRVTIPNAVFSDGAVENVSDEPSRKVILNLGLTYDTDEKGMELAMKLLREIADGNGGVEDDPVISFNAFGDFALGIIFIYYIKKDANIMDTQTEVNLAILKEFNANNLEMAFPTQTIYNLKS